MSRWSGARGNSSGLGPEFSSRKGTGSLEEVVYLAADIHPGCRMPCMIMPPWARYVDLRLCRKTAILCFPNGVYAP